MSPFHHSPLRHLLPLIFLVLLPSCGGQSPRQETADSLENAAKLPERSRDPIVAHACRIMDAAARDLMSDNEIPAVCRRASDAMGQVAGYHDSLDTEQQKHLDTPEARLVLRQTKQHLQESFDKRIDEIRKNATPKE